jgi:phenylalanyl-tRNA synthetase alpha chain
MGILLTDIQKQRLRELNAPAELAEALFDEEGERNRAFQEMEKRLVEAGRERLIRLRNTSQRPKLCELEATLADALTAEGFVQVVTPLFLSKGMLERMSITSDHPLSQQVYWVNPHTCLRPMLAPHLYALLKRLVRLWEKPIRIFEVGSCFRKDSKGSHHSEEFTMLNLVELGLPTESRHPRLKDLARLLMKVSGIGQYEFISESSDVYGETIDIIGDQGVELCSCAMGPHPLDDAWGITDPWVGLGLGLERLVMVREGYRNIQRAGRSLIYLDGVRLNI